MKMAAAAAVLALMAGTAMAASHAADPEWIGAFPLSDSSHTWLMQKVDGAYADPEMKLVIMPLTAPKTASKGTLETHEDDLKKLHAGTCPNTAAGTTLKPAATGSCFNLVVGSGDDSKWTIDTAGLSGALFAGQHVPTEFERDAHYLKDSDGADVEPAAEEGGGDGHAHAHGNVAKCECEAREHGYAIDCSKMGPVTTAVNYLTNSCKDEASRKTGACKEAYHKFQAHHDYCPHDALPTTLEGILHVHEEHYDDCSIHRMFNPAQPQCAAAPCADKPALAAATKFLYDNCNTCNSTACTTNFRTVLMAHDTCKESELPGTLELGLHDFEEKCESSLCNTATKATPLSSIECPTVASTKSAGAELKASLVLATVLGSALLLFI